MQLWYPIIEFTGFDVLHLITTIPRSLRLTHIVATFTSHFSYWKRCTCFSSYHEYFRELIVLLPVSPTLGCQFLRLNARSDSAPNISQCGSWAYRMISWTNFLFSYRSCAHDDRGLALAVGFVLGHRGTSASCTASSFIDLSRLLSGSSLCLTNTRREKLPSHCSQAPPIPDHRVPNARASMVLM
jgi:hypothetical protein